ncbi:hypothetical protein B0I37DRAFT_431525 [Chaetomium sp. MPI-CAGE-AT-0009]|nr:hypothetical protein B0I37DRAFT_431525 [Chaetomium sp. MPI-CAGE-AT-0009]
MSDEIRRDGFTYAYGRFYAQGRVERVDGYLLRAMFLPVLTQEAKSRLRNHTGSSFVRGQLQHYGVDYDERDFSGQGARLLKKMILAGKCDKVPDYIEELRCQMHTEWLEKRSDKSLSGHPNWLMEKYFVDGSGKPDTAKTTEVIGIPFPLPCNYDPGRLRKAAGRVRGLHHATGRGSTQTIYLGWDRGAVERAAKSHAAKESRADQAKADARERERASRHEKYLAVAGNPDDFGAVVPSPVGQYIIDCEYIERYYSGDIGKSGLTLDIHKTSTPGVYQATFDFGVIEGMMMLGHDKTILDEFCAQEEHSGSEGESEDEGSDEETTVGYKRKATGAQPRGGLLKKAKTVAGRKPKKYLVRLKSRDAGTGEIDYETQEGTITFGHPNLSVFTGKVDMCIETGVTFKARKVSAVLGELRDSWSSYSEAEHEYARVHRW